MQYQPYLASEYGVPQTREKVFFCWHETWHPNIYSTKANSM
ncbi:MAG: hypothetical protein FWF71_02850 [Actinomycetia bacterium]|nr:hypothetical protein [Actinomycetes bacterium]